MLGIVVIIEKHQHRTGISGDLFAELAGTPVGQSTEKYPDVAQSNPRTAIERFLAGNTDFQRVPPPYDYGPGNFLDGFLRREGHPAQQAQTS
jgi:hypothetical protein